MKEQLLFVHSTIDDAGLSVAAFRILCHLWRRGNGAWPAVKSMAAVCRLNKDTVKTALRELIGRGFLSRKTNPGKSSSYLLTWPKRGASPHFRPAPKSSQHLAPKSSQLPGPKEGPRRISIKDIQESDPSSTEIKQESDDNPWVASMAKAMMRHGGKGGKK